MRLTSLLFLTTSIFFAASSRAEVEDPAQRLDSVHLGKMNEILRLHTEATQETVRIRLQNPLTETTRLTDVYVEWAPTTSKPTSAVYVEISPETGELQMKAGIGVDALFDDRFRKDLSKTWAKSLKHDGANPGVERIVRKLLDRMETPLTLAPELPLSLENDENENTFTLTPTVRLPLLILVLFVAFISLGVFLWRGLFSEIHLTSERETRVAPWFGKRFSRKIREDRDLLTGGGIAGEWAP